MSILIGVFSLFILLAGVVLIIKPEFIFNLLDKYSGRHGLYVAAIAARLLLGSVLIYLSDISKYPLAFMIVGWISILAAIVFVIIGWSRFKQLMTWVLSSAKPFSPVAGVLSIGFGVFLIHALF